jgi:hypothetical protein
MRKIDPNLLTELLHEACSFLNCPCGRKWDFLAETFLRWEAQGWPDLSDSDFRKDLKLSVVTMLECVARHSTDRQARRDAQMQLLSSIFAEVRPWLN